MKIKLTDKIIPILLVGTITLVGYSKYKEYKNAEDYDVKNEISSSEVVNDETLLENTIEEQEIVESPTPSPTLDPTPTPTATPTPTPTPTPTVTPTPTAVEEVKEEPVEEQPITEEQPVIIEEPQVANFDGINIETKKVVEATGTVNVRSGANTNSTKLGAITKGSKLDVVNLENPDWYRVKYKNQEAFISSHYVVEKTDIAINSPLENIGYLKKDSSLLDPYNSNNVIMTIPKLEAVPIYKDAGGYYLTTVEDKVGLLLKSDVGILKDTFAIVDISDQTAYLYEGTQLILSSKVVTGKPSTPTTKGLHEVWHISEDRYLNGDDYKVYVDFFTAFCGGIGFHDSEYHTHYNSQGKKVFSHGWRASYGGNIYKTNGSHGCVNMPHDAAETFYKNLKIGDKVLVKQ